MMLRARTAEPPGPSVIKVCRAVSEGGSPTTADPDDAFEFPNEARPQEPAATTGHADLADVHFHGEVPGLDSLGRR
jgi:hypothetical protein